MELTKINSQGEFYMSVAYIAAGYFRRTQGQMVALILDLQNVLNIIIFISKLFSLPTRAFLFQLAFQILHLLLIILPHSDRMPENYGHHRTLQ